MVRGKRSIRLRQTPKYVRIQSTGNQFHGSSPATITLLAAHPGIIVNSYQWWRGSTTVGTNQNLIIANNQVHQVQVFKVKITATDGQEFEDSISLTKVNDGQPGRPGVVPIQREWVAGDTHRNNTDVIDYIYHRSTNTWWRLKDGFNNVVAPLNPTNQYIRLNAMEQLALTLLITEGANIAGFIFKDLKMISPTPSLRNSNLIINGKEGSIYCRKGVFTGIRLVDVLADRIKITTDRVKIPGVGETQMFLDTNKNGLSIGLESPNAPVMGGINFQAIEVNGSLHPVMQIEDVLTEKDVSKNERIDPGTMYMDSDGFLKLKVK